MGSRVSHQLGAHGGAARLGRGLVHGTHADVVDQLGVDLVDLLGSVGRQPDQHLRPDQLPHLGHGQVVLADVHTVRARLDGHAGTVVDDQHRPDPLAQHPRRVGDCNQLVVGQSLLAQLHDLHAARDGLPHSSGSPLASGGSPRHAADQIQARRVQARPSLLSCLADGHSPKSLGAAGGLASDACPLSGIPTW